MKSAWLVITALVVAACSSTPAQESSGGARTVSASDCVHHTSVTGYRALDDRRVVLYGIGSNDAYLAEIAPGCFGVGTSTSIGAVDGDGNGQICGYGRDEIAYREFARVESCRILSLEHLSKDRRMTVLGSK